ncbi:fimbria/pilus outer membrane usher protein [Pragia fontium]|uniref:fimbria/pilus outer membrane usher protein n=1 Tax=Pragia fontium TaxID=82985 RepID=UPI000DFB2606|nr:fimbria/pilus outer membrane usher protein [Pragia fontium]SUB82572.1 Outer membrane usher protein fimD precursor [Pragia fontium]VEJ55471.1 Outer membrane usher protein fimD precursor [Pragia fontium]
MDMKNNKLSHDGNLYLCKRFNVISLLLTCALPALGRDYFDPGLLSLSGDQHAAMVDLTTFETAGQLPEGEYLFTLYVNQYEQGQYNIQFKKNADGKIQPALTPKQLHDLGVNTSLLPAFTGLPIDKPILDLPTLIPESKVKVDLSLLRLDLSIPQIAMQSHAQGSIDPALWEQGVPALLLNYNLNGSRNWQEGQWENGHSRQDSLFANLRGGINLDAWRLRSDMTYSNSKNTNNIQFGSRQTDTRFTNTYLQRDIQFLRSEILFGENSTGNEVFDTIPFRGIKLNSNDEMLPYSLRGFAPLVSGVASTNARVTLSQNGSVIYQTYVAPGSFSISDLYQTGQAGDLTMTITEADGSVHTQTVAYSSLPIMQRTGGMKYEVTTGRYHGGITDGSQQMNFGLGTLMYGLPNNITLYGGGLVAQEYYSAVIGSGVSLGDVGALSADITLASAQIKGLAERQRGNAYRVRYAKSLLSTGTSIDLAAYRYSTQNYYSFSDANNIGYQLNDDQLPWALERQRNNIQLQVNQDMASWGSLFISASRDNYWGSGRVNNSVSAGYNSSYKGISYGLTYRIDRVQNRGNGGIDWPENRQISMNVQIPFNLFSNAESVRNIYASYQISQNNQGNQQQQAGITGTALEDHLAYSVIQGYGNQGQGTNGTLSSSYQGSQGMVSGGYSYGDSYRSVNMGATGGVVVHPQGVTLSQTLGSAVAIVSTPGASGVAVGNGSSRTNRWGQAVVPYLSDYQKNNISLDPSTLPDDVDVTQSSLNIYPTKGAVILANFATRVGFQALITLIQSNHTPVPFGAIARFDNPEANSVPNTSIVGDAGQVYLSGLPETGSLTAQWGPAIDQQCRARFNLTNSVPSKNNPLHQTQVTCEGATP